MRLITSLFNDPVGWTEWIAKTPFRILVMVSIHIGFIYWGFHKIAYRLSQHSTDAISALELFLGNFPIVFIGIAYPVLYFIAMYKLLKIIREKDKTAPTDIF